MTWQAGQFTITVGVDGVPTPKPVAGWISDLFALDFRVFLDEDGDYRKGWVLTHLPTGYVISKLAMDLNVPYRKRMMADGPRQHMLGNSIAVPMLEWLGRRIAMVESLQQRDAA